MTAVQSDAASGELDDPSSRADEATPVQVLDRRLHVTTPRTWMVFVGVVLLLITGLVWAALGRAPTEVRGQSMILPPDGLYELTSGVEGVVEEIKEPPGGALNEGDPLVVVRKSDGQTAEVKAPVAGVVVTLLVKRGTYVRTDTHVATISGKQDELIGVVYVPAEQGKLVRDGMKVFFSPSTAPAAQYGSMTGTVRYVSQLPASAERIRLNLSDNNDLVNFLTQGGPVIEIAYELDRDPSTPSGFKWTSGSGPSFPITSGTLGTASIVISEKSPLSQVLG